MIRAMVIRILASALKCTSSSFIEFTVIQVYAILSTRSSGMSIISLRVSDEEKAVLEAAAKFYKCNMSTLIKRLTFEKLEDEYDMKVSEDYLKQKKAGTLSLSSFDDLMKECGIDKETL